MVVTVLMISCQVFTSRNTKYDGAQTTTKIVQNSKNGARAKIRDACPANRSKKLRSSVTPLGCRAGRHRDEKADYRLEPWECLAPVPATSPGHDAALSGPDEPADQPQRQGDDGDPRRHRRTRLRTATR